MNLQTIIEAVANRTGISKTVARTVLVAALSEIATALPKAEKPLLLIKGFGSFKVKDTPERTGRNPGTGAPITIAAGRKVVFKHSAEWNL